MATARSSPRPGAVEHAYAGGARKVLAGSGACLEGDRVGPDADEVQVGGLVAAREVPYVEVGRPSQDRRAALVDHLDDVLLGGDVELPVVRSHAHGGDDLGVQYAVYEFMDRLIVTREGCFVSDEIHYREKPAYRLRGMYAHLHWQYNKPYALWSWNFEDWKEYIDLLARLRFNLLQIWSFVGSMPDPLSEGDHAFLQRIHEEQTASQLSTSLDESKKPELETDFDLSKLTDEQRQALMLYNMKGKS